MRLRRSRIETFYHRKRIVEKDSEGSTRERYDVPSSIQGESWPASGKVQAEQYGERLGYIRNVKLGGTYTVRPDKNGKLHYILENGIDLMELDGICLYGIEDEERLYQDKAIVVNKKILTINDRAFCISEKSLVVSKPDHKIIAIKAYQHLVLEVERV